MPGVERCLLQTARNSLSHRGNNRNCTIRCRLWTRTSNGTMQLGHRSNLDLGASPPDPLHARSRGATIPAPLSWLARVALARFGIRGLHPRTPYTLARGAHDPSSALCGVAAQQRRCISGLTRFAAARRTNDGRGGPSRAAPASLEIRFALGREGITPPACPPSRGLPEATGTADARQLEKPGFTAVPNSDRVVSLRSASGPGACDRRCPVPGTHVACCFDSAPAPGGRTVRPTHASCPAAGSTAG